MGDGRCGVFEKREKTTNKRDGRRERRGEKSAAKIWKSGKRTDAGVLLFAFFSSSFLLKLSSPSEVLLFLFEGTSFFVVVLCITLLRDIKNTPTLCCSTIIMGVLRVKGKDLIAFRC